MAPATFTHYGLELLPSYAFGYAQDGGMGLLPNMAWIPGLGKTGSQLLDVVNLQNHGRLTNMDPATDWVTGGSPRVPGYALDMDGIDDFINVGDLGFNAPATVVMEVFPRDVDDKNLRRLLSQRNSSISDGGALGIGGDGSSEPGSLQVWNGSSWDRLANNDTIAVNEWARRSELITASDLE